MRCNSTLQVYLRHSILAHHDDSTSPRLGSLSLRNFDGNLDRGIVSRNIGHVFIAQVLDGGQHHSILALSDLVTLQRPVEVSAYCSKPHIISGLDEMALKGKR
jgi:hypothetical protein